MVGKLLILVICITAVVHINAIELIHKEHDYGHAEYEFHYSVHDPHTGDIKSQKEVAKDGKIEGSYELIEPDGHKRVVHYKADDHHGFEAVVHREPTNIKIPIPEQHHKIIGHKILSHAPLVHYSHAPEPVHYQKSLHEEPHYDTHVHFSGPSHTYKY